MPFACGSVLLPDRIVLTLNPSNVAQIYQNCYGVLTSPSLRFSNG